MTAAVGFTGTRLGTTAEQHGVLRREIRLAWDTRDIEFHHGDCLGSDLQAHIIAWSLGFLIRVHPPTDPKLRARVDHTGYWDPMTDILLPEKPYLARNRDIVDATQLLIATPDGPERERSGTWSTIRHARSKDIRTIVIMPDGSVA